MRIRKGTLHQVKQLYSVGQTECGLDSSAHLSSGEHPCVGYTCTVTPGNPS